MQENWGKNTPVFWRHEKWMWQYKQDYQFYKHYKKIRVHFFFILKYLWCAVMPKLHGLNNLILHFVAVLIFFCSPLHSDPVITQKSWSPFHVPYLATYCFILWFFFGLLQESFDSLYIVWIVHYKQQCPSFDLHEEKKNLQIFFPTACNVRLCML